MYLYQDIGVAVGVDFGRGTDVSSPKSIDGRQKKIDRQDREIDTSPAAAAMILQSKSASPTLTNSSLSDLHDHMNMNV